MMPVENFFRSSFLILGNFLWLKQIYENDHDKRFPSQIKHSDPRKFPRVETVIWKWPWQTVFLSQIKYSNSILDGSFIGRIGWFFRDVHHVYWGWILICDVRTHVSDSDIRVLQTTYSCFEDLGCSKSFVLKVRNLLETRQKSFRLSTTVRLPHSRSSS